MSYEEKEFLQSIGMLFLIMFAVMVFGVIAFFGPGITLYQSYKSTDDQNKVKISEAKQNGYDIIVDGVEVESIDEDFDTNNFNILYDDTGKKVVLTTKARKASTRIFMYPGL